MNKKEQLISRILDVEWDLFQNVRNIGGLAPCQNDIRTFEINRFAQFMSWSEAAMESYMDDLMQAVKAQRNPMTEKYAYMMKSTHPDEYARILPLLPPIDTEVAGIVDQIMGIAFIWQEELESKYPHLIKRGRPLRSIDDTPNTPSFETYLRAELSTCSLKTLKLYYEHMLQQKAENINGNEITLNYVIKRYGYNSSRQANDSLGEKSSG